MNYLKVAELTPGLKSCDVLEFHDDLPDVKAVPHFDTKPMRSVAGRGQDKAELSSEAWLNATRTRVELP